MKYNHDYYIMTMTLPVSTRSRKLMKVKGSDRFAVLSASNEYKELPEIFIHKGDHGYIASDYETGMMVYEAARLKDVVQWIGDPDNIKRLVEAYQKPFIAKQKAIFQDMIAAAKSATMN